MFARLLGQVEDAPVPDAADCAAVAEDERAGCAGDSGGLLLEGEVMGGGKGEAYSFTSARLPGRTCFFF